ncbi:unknown [Eggerthella sp. CAG:1427]|nr:unknown [Eggerthella sp. CAG:1427]
MGKMATAHLWSCHIIVETYRLIACCTCCNAASNRRNYASVGGSRAWDITRGGVIIVISHRIFSHNIYARACISLTRILLNRCYGLSLRHGNTRLLRGLAIQAVALHFFFAQLRNNRSRNQLCNYFEFSVLQFVINNEANQRCAIHGKT